MTGQVEGTADEFVEELSHSEAAAMFRHESANTLKRAYSWLSGVTWFYRLSALAYALVTFFAILALARLEVPARDGVQVVVMTTLMAVLLVMAALRVLFEPLAWNLILAGLATAVALFHLVGPNPLGIALPSTGLLAILLWAALVPTLRFNKQISEHKDAYILHHVSVQTRRSLKGRTPEERHERLVGAMHRAGQRAWLISGSTAVVIVLASAIGTKTVLSQVRPPEFAVALAEFETAWNGSDLSAVAVHFDPRVRAQEIAWLGGVLVGHGWGDGRPFLADGRMDQEATRASVDYELEGIPVEASWILHDQHWSLTRIELPVPPLEPIVALFAEAWETSDPAQISMFFSADTQAEHHDTIEDAALRRTWTEFPEILATKVPDYKKGEATVKLESSRGTVTTDWFLRPDGTWGLTGLRFPKR